MTFGHWFPHHGATSFNTKTGRDKGFRLLCYMSGSGALNMFLSNWLFYKIVRMHILLCKMVASILVFVAFHFICNLRHQGQFSNLGMDEF